MTTKEKSTTTAEEKWAEFDSHWPLHSYEINDVSKTSREAYKSALRKAIDHYYQNAMKEKAHQYNGGLLDAYKTCLELLDTVEPD